MRSAHQVLAQLLRGGHHRAAAVRRRPAALPRRRSQARAGRLGGRRADLQDCGHRGRADGGLLNPGGAHHMPLTLQQHVAMEEGSLTSLSNGVSL